MAVTPPKAGAAQADVVAAVTLQAGLEPSFRTCGHLNE